MPTKVTVNLPDETVQAIKDIASKNGTTVTEALRQAIESRRFLEDEVDSGNKLLIKAPDQSLREIVFNTPKRTRA
jgi:predicted transcriptional regulator